MNIRIWEAVPKVKARSSDRAASGHLTRMNNKISSPLLSWGREEGKGVMKPNHERSCSPGSVSEITELDHVVDYLLHAPHRQLSVDSSVRSISSQGTGALTHLTDIIDIDSQPY